MKDDIYRSQFRLPYDLYEKLKEAADAKSRSVNAELVARLADSFDDTENQLRALNNKLAVSELTALVNEASLTASMLVVLANTQPNDESSSESLKAIQQLMQSRLKDMGDLHQRLKEITDRIIPED